MAAVSRPVVEHPKSAQIASAGSSFQVDSSYSTPTDSNSDYTDSKIWQQDHVLRHLEIGASI
jgi:hypothetical protein